MSRKILRLVTGGGSQGPWVLPILHGPPTPTLCLAVTPGRVLAGDRHLGSQTRTWAGSSHRQEERATAWLPADSPGQSCVAGQHCPSVMTAILPHPRTIGARDPSRLQEHSRHQNGDGHRVPLVPTASSCPVCPLLSTPLLVESSFQPLPAGAALACSVNSHTCLLGIELNSLRKFPKKHNHRWKFTLY